MQEQDTRPLVLVMGQDLAARQETVAALRGHGYEIVEAETAEIALAHAAELPRLSVVVCDPTGEEDAGDGFRRRVGEVRPDLALVLLIDAKGGIVRRTGSCIEIGRPAEPNQVAYAVANLIARK